MIGIRSSLSLLSKTFVSTRRFLSVKTLGDDNAFKLVNDSKGKKIYYFTASW